MSANTIMEHSTELEQALRYVLERLEASPELSTAELISDAGPRYDLSPMEQESLMRLIRRERQARKAATE